MRVQIVPHPLPRFLTGAAAPPRSARWPRDLIEYGDRLELVADLPGVAQEDVEVHFEKGVLQVQARTRPESAREGGRFLRRERAVRSFDTSLRVGDAVDVEGIRAQLDAGVLRVTIPKAEHLRPREIPVHGN